WRTPRAALPGPRHHGRRNHRGQPALMLRELTVRHCSFPLVAPFRIARGVKHVAEVVLVELRQGSATGRGESVPYARYGESVESVMAQLESVRADVAAGMGREELQARLPAGAARNALDSALWDL